MLCGELTFLILSLQSRYPLCVFAFANMLIKMYMGRRQMSGYSMKIADKIMVSTLHFSRNTRVEYPRPPKFAWIQPGRWCDTHRIIARHTAINHIGTVWSVLSINGRTSLVAIRGIFTTRKYINGISGAVVFSSFRGTQGIFNRMNFGGTFQSYKDFPSSAHT